MTDENKVILLTELSMRLPYNVQVLHENKIWTLLGVDFSESKVKLGTGRISMTSSIEGHSVSEYRQEVFPYLRPISSMTDKEGESYIDLMEGISLKVKPWKCLKLINWLNKHHFDYNDLIKDGLAIEAPKGMYNAKSNKYGKSIN